MKKFFLVIVLAVALFGLAGCDVEKIQNAVADVNNVAVPVAKAMQDANTSDITGLLQTVQAVNLATAPINPYAPMIAMGIEAAKVGIPLIIGILGFLSGRKNRTALAEVVKGGEKFKADADGAAITAFKTAQNSAQSTSTKKLVAVLKA